MTKRTAADDGYQLAMNFVSQHTVPHECWIVIDGAVYDVSLFLSEHPGGKDTILQWAGKDATAAFKGEGYGGHSHSEFALKLLAKHRIGRVAEGQRSVLQGNTQKLPTVDWKKPILPQVGNMGSSYQAWVHAFPTTEHAVELFPWPIIETLTKCPWFAPLLFWIPILTGATWLAFSSFGNTLLSFAPVFALGFLFWLFFEYSLHRYVFHYNTSGFYSNIFHFLIHGHHHITPMDEHRLVFPPIPALLVGLPVILPSLALLGLKIGFAFCIGFGVGYLHYDMIHFWIHHSVPVSGFLKRQKRRHIHHHYKDPNCNFGISNPLFDVAFKTLHRDS
eukprot:TRINITY_DN3981_c0_g1_i1.p1 TRINITY_DN3981_c0_g1~~TRINITY_DN3981_c0_g1_i1.p1  ORF type:complete len:333 (-),score=37.77 TRINITY_DN3981_c0_g1_i1:7-1005(-)